MIKSTIFALAVICALAIGMGAALRHHLHLPPPPPTLAAAESAYTTDGVHVEIISIGGCQYVAAYGSRGIAIIHHGACTNPIHRR